MFVIDSVGTIVVWAVGSYEFDYECFGVDDFACVRDE